MCKNIFAVAEIGGLRLTIRQLSLLIHVHVAFAKCSRKVLYYHTEQHQDRLANGLGFQFN